MSFSKPSVKEAIMPAARPERQTAITAEDVVLGGAGEDTGTTNKGKRALLKPAPSAASAPGVGLGI